jgi:tetratricopeptide (TPR) repeat protein
MKITSLLFLLFIHFNLFAQTKIIDSLKLFLEQNQVPDTTRLIIEHDIAVEYRVISIDTTQKMAQQVYLRANKIGYDKIVSTSLRLLGYTFWVKGEYDSAIFYYQKAKDISKKINDLSATASCLNNLGLVYSNQGNYNKAINTYYESIKLKEKLNDMAGVATTINNIGIIFQDQGEYLHAIENYKKALKIREEIKGNPKMAQSYNNIGFAFKSLKEYDSALVYLEKGIQIASVTEDYIELAYLLSNISDTYIRNGNPKMALPLLLEGEKVCIEKNFKQLGIYFDINFAKYFISLNQFEKAYQRAEKAIDNAQKSGNQDALQNAYLQAHIAKAGIKNFQEAYQFQSLYFAVRDSMQNAKNLKNSLSKEFEYKEEKLKDQQEKKELAFKAEREEQKRIKYTYLSAAIVALFILIVVVVGYRQKIKINQLLASQNKEITSQQIEIAQKNKSLNKANQNLQQQQEELIVLNENLEGQKQTIESTYNQLKTTTEQLDKSIQYASHIQSVVMPEADELQDFFKDLFVLFRPRDVVSGDFYWFSRISENQAVFSLADCTGHGVPGAFMSMLGATLLHETINIKKITDDPARILKNIHQAIRKILRQVDKKNNDGMDISICIFTKKEEENTVELIFSGAKATMSYVVDGQIHHLKGDRQYLGGDALKKDFTNQHLTLPINTNFYLYTDGYPDQNSPDRKKIGSNVFKEMLNDISQKDYKEQQAILEVFLDNHQQHSEQRDDISVIGLKI